MNIALSYKEKIRAYSPENEEDFGTPDFVLWCLDRVRTWGGDFCSLTYVFEIGDNLLFEPVAGVEGCHLQINFRNHGYSIRNW
jgi:hypothetical protein